MTEHKEHDIIGPRDRDWCGMCKKRLTCVHVGRPTFTPVRTTTDEDVSKCTCVAPRMPKADVRRRKPTDVQGQQGFFPTGEQQEGEGYGND